MAIESIAKTLGTGSGIDVTSLVGQLVEAQFAAKTAAFTRRDETLGAQISAAASLKSSVTAFDTALKSLIKTGTLQTQPTSANTGIVKVSALAGASAAGLSASLEVRQLASAQVTSAAAVASKTAAIGTGKLTLQLGTATVVDGAMTAFAAGAASPVEVDITAANSSLQGIADAVNARNAGVTASILSDSSGHRLVIKSATGAAQAFTLTATEDVGAPGLAALDVGVGATGTTIGAAAQDAVVAVDGIAVNRSTNAISDLLTGVRIDLVSASVGTRVSIGTQAPTEALGNAVKDFVDTYNELLTVAKEATHAVTGPLRADSAAKALLRSLAQLTVKDLVPGAAEDTPVTLAAIGVSTNRDGSLSANTLRIAASLIEHPAAIEAMFRENMGISAALGSIAIAASSRISGLGASETRYTAAKESLADDQAEAAAAAEVLRTRMTRQFATMDAAVASYKSTQTFLEQQVDAWNRD